MPIIRSSGDLRNNYDELAELCHQHSKPVFIINDGKEELVVMSIETYERLIGKATLHTLLDEGLHARDAGLVEPMDKVVNEIRTVIQPTLTRGEEISG